MNYHNARQIGMKLTFPFPDIDSPAAALPCISGWGTAYPSETFTQQEILKFIIDNFPVRNDTKQRYRTILSHPSIEKRHFALDSLEMVLEKNHDVINRRFEKSAVELSKKSLQSAIRMSGLTSRHIDYLVTATCTGYLCPGLSSHLVEEAGLRTDIHTADIVGMGCGAALPALEQASNFIKVHPNKSAAVVCTEICSAAMFSNDDLDIVISNSIFSDGSAAAILQGADAVNTHQNGQLHPRLVRFSSLLRPQWRDTLRFQMESGYLKNVLGKEVPAQAAEAIDETVRSLLDESGLAQENISRWILHAGGEKIITAVEDRLGLTGTQLRSSRNILKAHGNMSSPTVLFVLKESIALQPPQPGEIAVMISFGAGFSCYAALLRF